MNPKAQFAMLILVTIVIAAIGVLDWQQRSILKNKYPIPISVDELRVLTETAFCPYCGGKTAYISEVTLPVGSPWKYYYLKLCKACGYIEKGSEMMADTNNPL